MDNLKIKHLGPISDANISFGDLTLFVGPQASGKSIVLQLLKLILDKSYIARTLLQNNYTWDKEKQFLELYFGENTSGMFSSRTKLLFKSKPFNWTSLISGRGQKDEQLFYVPAQRVLSMSQGWPKAFAAYDIGDPFVLKQFSETLRIVLDKFTFAPNGRIFPQGQGVFSTKFDESVFHGGQVISDRSSIKKRFLLKVGNSELPFMTWSAGQKEFMPLLLSFYYLLPTNEKFTPAYKWVVIEEPEMGLHPKAIQSVMLVFLSLLERGYKIVVSTHSPVLLELAWLMKYLQDYNGTADDLAEVFSIKSTAHVYKSMQKTIDSKKFRTYFFDQGSEGVVVRDISSLDAANEDPAVSNWGGLADFSSKANDLVAKLVANEG